MNTLLRLLSTNFEQSPDAPALLGTSSPPITHREVWKQTERTIHGLRLLGMGQTDRVAIVIGNGPQAALAFLGVAGAASAAPLNPAYSADEFRYYLGDLRARLVVTDDPAGVGACAAASLGIPVTSFPLPEAPGTLEHPAPAVSETDVALVLHTSGTTSRPKLVPLTHGNLFASACNIARSLQLSADDRCLNIMPLFHVHGLIGAVLASLASGASVVCTPGFAAADFFRWQDEFMPTWYTGVPTMHQAIVSGNGANHDRRRASRLRFIRSCSSALPPTLLEELEKAFQVPVIEAYGMTEAAHQVAGNPLPPRIRKPGSVGVPTGSAIAVMNEAGALLGPDVTGEIVIRGGGVTSGYASPPDANARAFVDGWFRTGDQGRIDRDGYVFLTGRIKEIVNRGGEKVSPREVDELLLQHPAVAQAVAFSVPHPTLGEDLAAAVVLRAGQSTTERALRDFALARLAGFKVPSRIVIVDSIPKGPTGKLQRIGLGEKLAGRLKPVFVAPRDEIEGVIADVWLEVLGIAQLGVHDNFFAGGGDSLRASRVVARVNQLFQTELSVASVFHQPTIELYAEKVRGTAPPDRLDAITATVRELHGLSDAEVERLLARETE